jgi:hypothetical protein
MTNHPNSAPEEIKNLSNQGLLRADKKVFDVAGAKYGEVWLVADLPCSPVRSLEAATAQES